MTLQEVDEAIAALESALASGTEMVRYKDRTRTYRSVTEVKEALRYFKNVRMDLTGNKKGKRFSVVRFNA